MDKPRATIKNWNIGAGLGYFYLVGDCVEHHQKNLEGVYISSSRLLRIDFERGEAETVSTLFKLLGI